MNQPQSAAFGDVLRARIEAQELSVRRLGRLCGLDPATISRMLHDKQRPTLAHLSKLSQALDVPISALLTAAGYAVEEPEDNPLERMLESGQADQGSMTLRERWAAVRESLAHHRTIALTPEGMALIADETPAKMERIRAGGSFAAKVADLYRHALDEKTPPDERSVAGSALLYFVLEKDVIPDDQFPLGFVDDALAVDTAWEELFGVPLHKRRPVDS